MEQLILCIACGSPLNQEALRDNGIIDCWKCGARLQPLHEDALTYVDEIPEEEFLGG